MTIQKNKYKFIKYSKDFPNLYKKEKDKLMKILPKDVKMEHIGSTSVPGLGGKGIVDITIAVKKGKNKIKNILLEKKYEIMPNASGDDRISFKKIYKNKRKTRRVHVHLTAHDGKEWKGVIAFRDYLIKHSHIAKEYAKIKKEAVKIAKGEGKLYRKHKEAFIKKITKLALKEQNT